MRLLALLAWAVLGALLCWWVLTATAGGQPQTVVVCHSLGSTYSQLSLPPNAAEAHRDHPQDVFDPPGGKLPGRRTISDTGMDPDAHSPPDGTPSGHFPGEPRLVAVYDAGAHLILHGHATSTLIDAILTLAGGLSVRSAEPGVGAARPVDPHPAAWGRQLLPLRAHPDTDARPDGYAHSPPDVPAGTDPDAFTHTHRHAHRARPDAFLSNGLAVYSFTHAHRHAHPGAVPDDRTYHHDHSH